MFSKLIACRMGRLSLLPLLLLSSCQAPTLYPQHPLARQILSPRPGWAGKLTNQACVRYEGEKCSAWNVNDYDVSDPAFQKLVNDLGISCQIGDRRYKICRGEKDSSGKIMNGFCRISYTQKCFLFICGKMDRKVDFFPIDPFDAVLKSGVRCFNEKLYPEELHP